MLQLLELQQSRAEEMQRNLRIDRARAGRHRHAVERAVAHRRVDRPARLHGRDRAPAAEMTDDEALDGNVLGRPLHREPVESETADPPLVAPALWNGEGRRLL